MQNQYIKSFWVAHSEKVNLVELPRKKKKRAIKTRQWTSTGMHQESFHIDLIKKKEKKKASTRRQN